jgi:hypothetical protein
MRTIALSLALCLFFSCVNNNRNMDTKIKITSIGIAEPHSERGLTDTLPDNDTIDIRVNLAKISGNKPVYMYQGMTRYDYDPLSKILTIKIGEYQANDPATTNKLSTFLIPNSVEIVGDDKEEMIISIPRKIRRLVPIEGKLGMGIEEKEITEINQIDFSINYGNTKLEITNTNIPMDSLRKKIGDCVRFQEKTVVKLN